MSEERIYVGKDAFDLNTGPKQAGISKVVCDTGNGNTITVGDDTGGTLNVKCEWGNESTVAAMLEAVRGIEYQPIDTRVCSLNPAAEIGDGITVGDTYTGAYNMELEFGTDLQATVKTSSAEELDHEYPTPDNSDKYASRRQLAQGTVAVNGGCLSGGSVPKSALDDETKNDISEGKQALIKYREANFPSIKTGSFTYALGGTNYTFTPCEMWFTNEAGIRQRTFILALDGYIGIK